MTRSAVGDVGSTVSKRRLISAFRRVLSPQKVDDVRITHEDAGVVLGFILTDCPVEKQSRLEDFEAHIHGNSGRLLDYVVVGGRRIKPKRLAHGRPGSTRRTLE